MAASAAKLKNFWMKKKPLSVIFAGGYLVEGQDLQGYARNCDM
jgi:hypothetical protein